MGDLLAELFDHFDQEEQARIGAAEASTAEILAQGTAAVTNRRRIAESLHDGYWLLQPENDARVDSAGVVFTAYVNALWRKTDAARSDCIPDFLAKVEELIEPVLMKYGWEGKDLIAELRGECQINASQVHSMLHASPASTTPSTEDQAASPSQDGTDHVSGRSEAAGAAEQSEMERGQSGVADRPVISAQPPAILEFSDSWRKRKRRNADLQAAYARQSGRNLHNVQRQEDLLKDARVWAKAELRKAASELRDVLELKEQVVKLAWDKFVPMHRYHSDFDLGYREFVSALWEEEWPSLEDCALEALVKLADSAGGQAAVVTGFSADGRAEDRARLAASSFQGVAKGANRVGRPARPQIEKFANTAFAVKRNSILAQSEEKLNHMLSQVRLTGNSGGYLPAHIKWGQKQVREMIFAWADARVEAFTAYGVPCDAQAETDLKAFARQTAAGMISGIRGRLRLRAGRLRIAEEGRGLPWHLDLTGAMNSARDEALLRLARQKAEQSQEPKPGPAAKPPGSDVETPRKEPGSLDRITSDGSVRDRQAEWREDAAIARECPPFLLPAEAARLDAIAKLRKDAADIVQRTTPQEREDMEQCLWPALSEYAQQVFDRMAEARLDRISVDVDSKAYVKWLRSECWAPVVADVCLPIFGQFPITLRYIAEAVGEVSRPPELVRMRQVLWLMIAEEIIPGSGSCTKKLEKRLMTMLMEERIPYWEAEAARPPAKVPKPVRRNAGYAAIDSVVREIAQSKPKTHEEVFNLLDGRVAHPSAEPFKSARGWHAGFKKDPARARTWLSKSWSRLKLPAFSRGPK